METTLPATIEKKELTITPSLNWNDSKIVKIVRDTCAPTATDSEWEYFLMYCQSTNLNPLKREVWFIKTGGKKKPDGSYSQVKIQIMTGINGFFSIANDHPYFDGMSDPQYEFDKNEMPICCKIQAFRKDRGHPATGIAYMREYFQKGEYGPSMWEKKPCHMLAKVAKSIALREAFPQQLGGLYTEDEMPLEYSQPNTVVQTPTLKASSPSLVAPSSASAPQRQGATRTAIGSIPEAPPGIETAVLEDGTVVDNATGEILEGPTAAVQAIKEQWPGTTTVEPTEEGMRFYKLPWEMPGHDMKPVRQAIKQNYDGKEGYYYNKEMYMHCIPGDPSKISNFPFDHWETDIEGKYLMERSTERDAFWKWKKGGGAKAPAPKPAAPKKDEVTYDNDNISF